MTAMVIFTTADGNGVGLYYDAPVPRAGDIVHSEGERFLVESVVVSYANDDGPGTTASVRVRPAVDTE